MDHKGIGGGIENACKKLISKSNCYRSEVALTDQTEPEGTNQRKGRL